MKIKAWLLAAAVFRTFCAAGLAASGEEASPETASYSGTSVSSEGFSPAYTLNDENERTFAIADKGSVSLHNDGGIASLYVVFNRIPEPWTLSGSSGSMTVCGGNRYLHEFVDVKARLGELPQDVTLNFTERTSISEIYAFTEGALPEWVQIWEPPCEKADILLFSAHSDDEHLFFAGIIPYYAAELGLNVQVVYITNHFDTYDRPLSRSFLRNTGGRCRGVQVQRL